MSEFPVELVEKELEDLATPNDIAVLASNKLLWRRHVVDIKAKLEADLQGKKADSMRSGFMNHQAMTKFQEFKKRAAHIKAMVDMRLSKLKIEIKEENRTKSRDVGELPLWDRQLSILEAILSELEDISDFLRPKSTEPEEVDA